MQDGEYLSQYGHLIIRGLLETLQELRKVDATLHTLEPQTIFISPQATKLVVADLFGVTYKGKRVLEQPPLIMPYSNSELEEHSLTGAHDQERDLWSVGIIILEMFLG